MSLDYEVLSRLLYIQQEHFSPNTFTVTAGLRQTEKSYMVFYTNQGMRILAVTEDRLEKYRQAFPPGCASTDAEVVEQVRDMETGQVEAIGPIFLSLLAPDAFTLQSQDEVNGYPIVKLDERHIPSLKALQAACKPIEWDHASLDYDDLSTAYGALDENKVIAVAHYLVFGDIASIGVVTHPEYRGKGLVTALTVSAIRHALSAGCDVIYRTMGWNTPAIQVALKLGFNEAGEYYVMRL